MLISAVLVVLIGVLSGCSALSPTATPTAVPEGVNTIDPPLALQNFTLIDQHGLPFSLANLKGRLALITFGYTHCPDVCPINLANFKDIAHQLGTNARQVAFVFVSVDGKRDTPAVMANYINLFDTSFIGLTGDDSAIHPVTQQLSVTYIINPPTATDPNYTVTHTAASFLLDQQGRWVRLYSYGTLPTVISTDMLQFLKS